MDSILDIIEKKKQGLALSEEEIRRFVLGAARGTAADYQLSALLMAIRLNGMTKEETRHLTLAMAHSGEVMDLSGVGGLCVDKHSTGGVGDTTTLVLTPLVAATGAKVAKMSGKGLGFTGGTLDKLEAIKGLTIALSQDAFLAQIARVGCAIVGQSRDLAPADGVLYSLRDVTATVDSMPLIVSSVMSKKIAAGAGAIVLDVKTGSGALMHTLEESIALAQAMVDVGAQVGRPTWALISGMDQPLGTHIGNALEVKEAIDILSGRAGGRLLAVSLQLGAMMLLAGGYAADEKEAMARLTDALTSGRGLKKLQEMIIAQGGDGRVAEDSSLLPQAKVIRPILATASGYVAKMDTALIGEASRTLGAGRFAAGDTIDPAVGLVMAVSLGDPVTAGQPLCHLHVNDPIKGNKADAMLLEAIHIQKERPTPPPLMHAIVKPTGVFRL